MNAMEPPSGEGAKAAQEKPVARFFAGHDDPRHERIRAIAREHFTPALPARPPAVKKTAAERLLTAAWWMFCAAMGLAVGSLFASASGTALHMILAAVALYGCAAVAVLGALLWHFYGRRAK